LYTHRSITAFHEQIDAGEISCASVTLGYLSRIRDKVHLNAFVEVYADEALQRAQFLDEKKKSGIQTGKLFGVVVAIKDVICHKGHRVTAGSKILANFTSIYSATAVERMLAEDAIIIGSLNCDEFAMGSSNENSTYGKVLNPLDESRVPGGSSGGSAAAVAAGLCMVSLGSDTGGSVRQPADFCGIIGFKPGYGRISRYGLIAYASSFDQIGILGTAVEDIALMLAVIAGSDGMDSTATQEAPSDYHTALTSSQTYRIAYFNQAMDHPALDPEIAAAMKTVISNLKAEGHHVEGIDVDFLDYVVPTYYILTTAEASSNLSRFDGVKFGHRTKEDVKDLDDFYKKTRSEGFGKEVKRRIMLGTFVLSTGYFDAYFTRAQQARQLICHKTALIFNNFDIIILPTSPTTAFRFGEKSEDAVSMFLSDIFTVYANLAGIPGISFPVAKHSNGMAFGIQGMSAKNGELILLRFAKSQYP
jgi:aspartyl-tRNA(Asn)/glutamyl-tRNA(Gln) amidotransferase subunit A